MIFTLAPSHSKVSKEGLNSLSFFLKFSSCHMSKLGSGIVTFFLKDNSAIMNHISASPRGVRYCYEEKPLGSLTHIPNLWFLMKGKRSAWERLSQWASQSIRQVKWWRILTEMGLKEVVLLIFDIPCPIHIF